VSVIVKYDKKASNTDAFAILAEAWYEMVQDGLTPDNVGVPPFTTDSEVIYAISKEGDIVGVLTWDRMTDGAFNLTVVYVEPSSRRQGVFKAMVNKLIEIAKKDNTNRIIAALPGVESVVRAFSAAQFAPVSTLYEFELRR